MSPSGARGGCLGPRPYPTLVMHSSKRVVGDSAGLALLTSAYSVESLRLRGPQYACKAVLIMRIIPLYAHPGEHLWAPRGPCVPAAPTGTARFGPVMGHHTLVLQAFLSARCPNGALCGLYVGKRSSAGLFRRWGFGTPVHIEGLSSWCVFTTTAA